MTVEIALLIGNALVKYGVPAARELVKLFQKETISVDDWEKVFVIAEKSYEDYVKPK